MKNRILAAVLAVTMCVGLGGCVNKSSWCVKVEGHSVSAGMYAYQLMIQKSNYLSSNSLTESNEMWDEEYDDTMTIGQYVQTMTLQTLVSSCIWRSQFDKLGLKFTDEEQKEIDEKIEQMVTASGGKDAINAELKEYGISYDEYIEASFYDSLKILKVVDYYYGAGGLEPVPEADIMNYFNENYCRCKHILLSTNGADGSALTDDQIAEVKKKAESVLAKAEKANEADFDKLIKEYNEDEGVAANPNGYLFTMGEMDDAFEKASFDMKIGETRLVRGTYGYHIIRKLDLSDKSVFTNQVRQNMLMGLKSREISKMFAEWSEDYKVQYNKSALAKYTCKTVAVGEDVSAGEDEMVAQLADQLGLEETK